MSSVASASAAASATAAPKAPPQGGILEGVSPVHYDTKNPIILFIIQVPLATTSPAHQGANVNPPSCRPPSSSSSAGP